ncbi:MAG TPA: primosomal protein N' [Candidatus Omnitrophota bacterium]|nr:primosomal protein N' [Candidatus Omnitrophota bacterium]
MKETIAQIVVGLPVEGPFDYFVDASLQRQIATGQRVRVLFNKRKKIGYIVGFRSKSAFKKLNPVLEILDTAAPSLDEKALRLTKAFSDHYGCSWGESIEAYFPPSLRGAQKTDLPLPQTPQKDPLQPGKATLVHDIGWMKHWEIVYQRIEEQLKSNKGVILLFPEKNYVDEACEKLASFQERIIRLDKKLPLQAEKEEWEKIKTTPGLIVLGTRRAVFAPLLNLGLIVIYEEDHSAYKQDQTPHYHVNEVALMRRRIEGADVMFVSACPSAVIWENTRKQKWEKLSPEGVLASVQLVDMGNYNPQRSSFLSVPLQNNIRQTLEKKGKVMLFMNRRGFTTMTRCNQCGFTMKCPRCDCMLTFLYSKKKLVCRHCNHESDLPKICPQCQGSYLRSTGMGIEKLESDVARLYPEAKVAHYDKETKAFPEQANVILATQAIIRWRGHLKSDLTAVMNFDAEINRFDFRCAQKAFSLLVRLAQMTKDKLLIQTRDTENYCLKAARHWDFDGFYRQELKFSKELQYPPFAHLLAVNLRGKKEEAVLEQGQALDGLLKAKAAKNVEVSEPSADVIPKLRDQYRYTIMLKGKNLKPMLDLAKKGIKEMKKRSVVIALNVDP